MTEKDIKEEIFQLQRSIIELQYRATGRTTRLVDSYIQKLFDNPDEWVAIYDHWDERRAAAILVDRISKRLDYEHKLEAEVKSIEKGYAMCLKNYHKPDFSQEIAQLEEMKAELEARLDGSCKYI